jgi:uncharacterized membrane protein
MDWLAIGLRILHVGAGVLWVGAAFAFFFFVQPSTGVLPPAGRAAFMAEVVRRRFPTAQMVFGVVAVLAGIALYWRGTNGLAATTSGYGIGFGLGGVAAIMALAIGGSVIAPTTKRLAALGGQLAGAGRPPTREEAAAFQALQRRQVASGRAVLVLLAISVVFMAVSRYL